MAMVRRSFNAVFLLFLSSLIFSFSKYINLTLFVNFKRVEEVDSVSVWCANVGMM
ncbi:MAG: hypothetical protein CH104c_0497 [Candidatus Woesebacteria bacterium]|nr:MAG: hypothetical protein CH104c_0497 [Candidatus Woesebacteria bacterium]